MITTLDSSHKCIVENWDALERMNACREQVEDYVKEIAKRAFYGLKPIYRDFFDEKDGIAKGVWMQLNPNKVSKLKECGDCFFGVGIETFKVQTIIRPATDSYCRAYVYSVCHKDKTRQILINNAIVNATKPPKDFERGDLESGYIYENQLATLTPQAFEDPKELESYFSAPMRLLIEWWNMNEQVILEAVVENKGAQ